jgi:(1->4)-alpha-D-glucan 1-alpha-D-glucosylmutase
MRFQQYTAPVQAKGVEDTAFYRYHVLVSLNEVGGAPADFGLSVAEWHRTAIERRRRHPGEMLATTTHDTKRSEDARARINVISEAPDEWQAAVMAWRRINATNRTRVGGSSAPDANDEYLFYQSLVGVWPNEGLEPAASPTTDPALVARMCAYMQKAIREAKLHTSWITPNPDYEAAVDGFVQRTLTGKTADAFLASFVPFVRRLARAGATNALAQLVLKLSAPGVPDIYQGTELWDLSLVDPDNRRPVDWAHRRRLLESLGGALDVAIDGPGPGSLVGTQDETVATLLDSWTNGRLKLFVTALGLRWRRAHPAVFIDGDYLPLAITGPRAEHVVAFARRTASEVLITVVPRLTFSLAAPNEWPVDKATWESTSIRLPSDLAGRPLRSLFTGGPPIVESVDEAGAHLLVRDVLRRLPVALLSSVGAHA